LHIKHFQTIYADYEIPNKAVWIQKIVKQGHTSTVALHTVRVLIATLDVKFTFTLS